MSNETALALALIHPALEVRSLAEKIVNYNERGFRTRRLTKKLKFMLRRPDEYFEKPKLTEQSLLAALLKTTFPLPIHTNSNPFNKGDNI